MMNMNVMTMAVSETPCTQHEEQIQENAKKIAELEAKNGFKAQRINELIEDNKRIESKIDKLTESVNKSILASVQGDSDLKERVLALETKADTQEKLLREYEEKARKQRDEERQKTNIRLAIIGIVITIISLGISFMPK